MTGKSTNALRVFVSSTYEDMVEYRKAVIDELTNIEVLPRAMEQFVSSPDKPLDVVLAEVRRCQLFIALVGMRYGSIDPDTGKSFSELEYEEAVKNGIPVLAFVIDENECPVLPKYVDVGEPAEKLKKFKSILNTRYASRFKSIENLKELVVRAVKKQLEETDKVDVKAEHETEYKSGALLYKKFLLLPEKYAGSKVFLRIRLSGKFGTWLVKDELFTARGLSRSDTLFVNDGMYVLGADFWDVDMDGINVDFFAQGKAADWILDNNVTLGTIFEGTFKLTYEIVPNVSKGNRKVRIAAAVLISGNSVIGKDEDFIEQERNKLKSSVSSDDDETKASALLSMLNNL